MKLDSFTYSVTGGRDENQDCVGKCETETAGIYVVADGLGGHRFGRQAAECVVNTLLKAWNPDADMDEAVLTEQIGAANQAVLALQQENTGTTKSTVVALTIRNKKAVWGNSGDSRIYYIHSDRLTKITEDHSVAYKKYKAGEITRDEIATDEDQSSLLRALGNTARWEPDTYCEENITGGDAFLLCSDGFWEYVMDEEILVDFLKSRTAKEWAQQMLLRAAERINPGNDNLSLITVIVT